MLAHESLENYYRTNFVMVQHHKWSLETLENMLPWEREVYVQQLRVGAKAAKDLPGELAEINKELQKLQHKYVQLDFWHLFFH